MKKILLFAIGLGLCQLAYGQQTYLAGSTLNDSTSVISIPVMIKPGTQQINCLFSGKLTTGSLDISLRDPEGRHQAGFSLEADEGEKKGGAKGGSRQEFKNPFVGNWQLRIQLKHATGEVSYQIDIKH